MSNLRQQDLPPEDLGDLAAPAPRGKGLAGLIGSNADSSPPAQSSASSTVTAPAPPEVDELPQYQPEVAVSDTPVRRRAARPGRPRTRTKPVSAVYVSPGVKTRFEKYRHSTKATNLQVVLEAISSQHDNLAGIIAESSFSTAPVDPLFPADPTAVRYLGGGSVQIGFSPTPDQEQVLDRIGGELGFDTRSTWIAPVLNAFLPGRKDT